MSIYDGIIIDKHPIYARRASGPVVSPSGGWPAAAAVV
jgi:hypothetical protein